MASGAQKVAYSTSVQFIGRIIVSGLGAFSVAFTTRYLGLNGYGQLTAAIIYTSIFATITDSGISLLAIREIANSKRTASNVIGHIVALRLLIVLPTSLISIFAGSLIYSGKSNAPLRHAIVFLSLSFILSSLQTAFTSGLAARLRNDLIVVGDILGKFTTIGLIFYSIHYNLGFNGIVLATIIGNIINFVSDLLFGLWDTRPSFKIERAYLKWLFISTLPMAASAIINTFYYRADGFLLSLFRGAAEVGIYGVAYKIIELTMYFPIAFTGAVFPLMAAAQNDLKKLHIQVTRTLKFLNLAAFPMTLGVILLSPTLSKLLGGEAFAAAAVPMSLLMIGNFFIFQNFGLANALLATQHQKSLLRLTGINLVVNLGLNLLLIPLYGIKGASIAVLLTELLQTYNLLNLYRKHISKDQIKIGFSKIIASTVAMSLVVFGTLNGIELAHIHSSVLILLISATVGGLFYSVFIFMLKAVTIGEIRQLITSKEAI